MCLHFAWSGYQIITTDRKECSPLSISPTAVTNSNVASLRVGIPTKDGFLNLTVDYFVEQTGMTLKRVERALADLKTAGLITVSQPHQLLP